MGRAKRVGRILFVGLVLFWFAVAGAAPPHPAVETQTIAAGRYDLNGDGLVSEADLHVYRDTLNRLDFDGNGTVDIFDQTLLAYQVDDANPYQVYLPVILR